MDPISPVSSSVSACSASDAVPEVESEPGVDAEPEPTEPDGELVAEEFDVESDDDCEVESEEAEPESEESADATPCPANTAAPTPSAKANPPTRPM
jgi:hypothetical protein